MSSTFSRVLDICFQNTKRNNVLLLYYTIKIQTRGHSCSKIESNPTVSTVIFQIQSCVFILSLSSLVMSKISTLHAWFGRSLLKLCVFPSPMKSHEKNYKWNKIVLFDSLCYMTKKGNIKASNISFKLSAFTSLRDVYDERHIFLPLLFLILQRNLNGADFDHVLGNHF